MPFSVAAGRSKAAAHSWMTQLHAYIDAKNLSALAWSGGDDPQLTFGTGGGAVSLPNNPPDPTKPTDPFGVEQALLALVLRPVITGIGWYSSFDTPDASGLVAVASGATVRGGHEVVADQIDAGNKLVWFWNSWGPGFGVGGRFCMAFDTWQRLLQEHGDVTVPLP